MTEEKLCICRDQEDRCYILGELPTNMFLELSNLDEALENLELHESAKGRREDDEANASTARWSWEKVEGCELYYIMLYNGKGRRIREHEIVVHPGKTYHEFSNSIGLDEVRVLSLHKTTGSNHGFVKILKARGLKTFDLVIDLSQVKNENRKTTRTTPVKFGFLSPADSGNAKYSACKRVACKNFPIGEVHSDGRTKQIDEIKEQIDRAMEIGGQYITKYLACTEIDNSSIDIWIAMEACIETLDVLIDRKSKFDLEPRKVKVCMSHILHGLIYLESNNVRHGEMILENMLISLDGKHVKICEYDHSTDNPDTNDRTDLSRTAEMFFKCLKRDSKSVFQQIQKDNSDSIEKWTKRLQNMKEQLRDVENKYLTDENAYLAAYLLLYMTEDCSTAQDVLIHPFFWDEYETLSFVNRMDASFNGKFTNVLPNVEKNFKETFKLLYGEIDWVEKVKNALKKRYEKHEKMEKRKGMVTKDEETISEIKEGRKQEKDAFIKYDRKNILRFLRYVRNTHSHFHERNERCFDSSADVWGFFNSIYPGMICLLHRAVWQEQRERPLPHDDIQRYFLTPKSVETLDLLEN